VWNVDYYTTPSGEQPVADWLNGLEKRISAHIFDKIVRLQQYGLTLLKTNMMKMIEGYGNNFYEMKYGHYRVAVFHDTANHKFVLLHGFKKERKRESREIKIAYSRLCEYQSRR
jgi:phage-related protein